MVNSKGSRALAAATCRRAWFSVMCWEAHGVGSSTWCGRQLEMSEDLHVAEEPITCAGVEGVALVAVDLVEGLAQFFTARLSSM